MSDEPTRPDSPSTVETVFDPSPGGQRGAAPARPDSTTSGSSGERYLPGAVIAGRYRVVGLIGRGGMGEVYRADDLKLGQTVALKFLPTALQHDESRLQLLLDEVRLARRVAHPNVCRVYDVGEADGQQFLCMEYVDGEDLAALLRRIGRLPRDKAIQLARQLCAGLSAAHREGIVHRDLKPANVMIDGRGRARITDFGLAKESGAIGSSAGEGTPAYMAPEQLEGREATSRSDIYALGLVLYELFTGKQPFSAQNGDAAINERSAGKVAMPSSHVESLDPGIEQAILRCLESRPSDRPGSPLEVAAALPGGDALTAALAAGETPSPEMVAAAPAKAALSPWVAWAAVALCLVAVVVGQALEFSRGVAPDGRHPFALGDEAEKILRELGHEIDGHDSAWGYSQVHRDSARPLFDPAEVEAIRSGAAPPYFVFWYRSSPTPLFPSITPRIAPDDPPRDEPGSALVMLSTGGDLVGLDVTVARSQQAGRDQSIDWGTMVSFTGLELADLDPAEATLYPPGYATRRAAWTGAYGDGRELRLEAAAIDGRVSWLRVFSPGSLEPRSSRAALPPLFMVLLYTLFVAILGVGAMFALVNWRSGRGDRRGAVRVALLVGASVLLFGLLSASHRLVFGEMGLGFTLLAEALFFSAMTAMFYLGLEPMLRRRWPHRIVAWSRILEGRFTDPLVGLHLLVGAIAGLAMAYLDEFGLYLAPLFGSEAKAWTVLVPNEVTWHLAGYLAWWPASVAGGVTQGLGFAILLLAVTRLVRSDHLAGVLLALVMTFGLALRDRVDEPAIIIALFVSTWIPFLAFLRFGLLAFVTSYGLIHTVILPPSTQYSENWLASPSTVLAFTPVVVAAYGGWIATRGGD